MDVFLIGAGGTGMRCLEAFVNLCAIGMMDGYTVHILAIDTDANNKDKDNAISLIEHYIKIKGGNVGTSHTNTFFSANIKLYKFITDYTQPGRQSLHNIAQLQAKVQGQKNPVAHFDNPNVTEQVLADLFFDEDVQKFALDKGYRAQTHIGSLLMYNSILEDFRNNFVGAKQVSELRKFWNELSTKGNAKVFIFGSLFGGTGASSLPVIPKAFKEAPSFAGMGVGLPNSISYGATLLTNYFTFNNPNQQFLKNELIVASSDKFPVNSQAALMYYDRDPMIRNTFSRLYMVGWDKNKMKDYSPSAKGANPNIGGATQNNPAHFTELLSAFAAYDFFKTDANNLPKGNNIEFLYRTVQTKGVNGGEYDLNFSTLVNDGDRAILKSKLTKFLAFSLMLQNNYNGDINGLIKGVKKQYPKAVAAYANMPKQEVESLNSFMEAFFINYDGNGNINEQWFAKIQDSTDDQNFLDYLPDVFTDSSKQLKKLNWLNLDGNGKKIGLFGSVGNTFIGAFNNTSSDPLLNRIIEKLINHIYKALD